MNKFVIAFLFLTSVVSVFGQGSPAHGGADQP